MDKEKLLLDYIESLWKGHFKRREEMSDWDKQNLIENNAIIIDFYLYNRCVSAEVALIKKDEKEQEYYYKIDTRVLQPIFENIRNSLIKAIAKELEMREIIALMFKGEWSEDVNYIELDVDAVLLAKIIKAIGGLGEISRVIFK